ncbi:MAG: hydrogenase nickel incorporation protein HypB [Lachnospiraceae bacterium]|nr:hydrogenase nickel incorporation protein HypB [Lachnospiraceae bacterium]
MYEIYETKERIIADNDAVAALVRERMDGAGVFFVNVMASPGAGKTTLLKRTIESLPEYKIGVMEADVDSDVDAATLAATGAKVIQLHTGGLCHMDADMTLRGLTRFGTEGLDIVFLENVGNLVCPAEFDVGADLNVMLLSVPEGDDKPLKYPLMFTVSQAALISKMDVAPVFDFDLDRFKENIAPLNPEMTVIPLSAVTGEGFDAWLAYLKGKVSAR